MHKAILRKKDVGHPFREGFASGYELDPPLPYYDQKGELSHVQFVISSLCPDLPSESAFHEVLFFSNKEFAHHQNSPPKAVPELLLKAILHTYQTIDEDGDETVVVI